MRNNGEWKKRQSQLCRQQEKETQSQGVLRYALINSNCHSQSSRLRASQIPDSIIEILMTFGIFKKKKRTASKKTTPDGKVLTLCKSNCELQSKLNQFRGLDKPLPYPTASIYIPM